MKRIFALILALVLLAGMLPAGMPKASAMYTWLKDRTLVDGSHFTRSAKMAEKLNSIFDGNASIYHDAHCTDPMIVPFGTSDLKNNGIIKYVGAEGEVAINGGTSCWIYANGVYYTLFGECTYSGVAQANSEKLSLTKTSTKAATYENFCAWGVRPAVGALIRADGHSMIVLGYDAQILTILDANGNGNGLVSIRIRTWDEVKFNVEYIIQPKADFYSEAYPGWEAPAISEAYPASCALEVTEEAVPVRSQPGADSLILEQAVQGVRYEAVRLVKNGEGTLWYEVRTADGALGYLPGAAAAWLADIEDVTAPGVTAPAHHPVGQSFSLIGSVVSESSELNGVSAFIYRQTEEGKTAAAGSETQVTGHYYNLSKSPMDQSDMFSTLTEGAYTYEVAATYTRCHLDAQGELVSQTVTRTLYTASFQMTDGAVICNHAYSTAVTQQPTCGADGSQTVTCSLCATGYTELVPATGAHTYAEQVALEAACTRDGVRLHNCTGCPAGYFEAIPATGHSFGPWQTVTPVSCTADGAEKQICAACGLEQSRALPATGHNYVGRSVEANCSDYAKELFTCENCGDSYSVYPDPMTQWSETKPEGIEESRLETKTQYRYSDYETVTSLLPEMPGYTLESSSWTEPESATCEYVKQWPSGFSQEHSLYAAYNLPAPVTAETETQKTEAGEETQTSWLYYHWCENSYAYGPINRGGKAEYSSRYHTFHAFYSTVSPTTLQAYSDGSYVYSNADCCRDTYWYFAVPVYHCAYTTSQKQFTYAGWTDWSDWSDTEYTATEQRKVEQRLLYRYSTQVLGDHDFAESKVTAEPTCLEEGVLTLYCSYCDATQTQPLETVAHRYEKGSCVWCEVRDPDYFTFTAHPQDETVKQGNRAAFTVAVDGEVASYQWQYQLATGGAWWNCTQYTMGYNTPTLNVLAAQKREGFLYRCCVTDTDGNRYYSRAARLSVDIPENSVVLSQPKDTWVIPGSTTTFHIDTQGEGLSFQWEYRKDVSKPGAWFPMSSTAGCYTDTLTIAGISGSINRNGWAYRCVVTDGDGYVHTTDYGILRVAAAQIVSQPESQSAAAGSTVQFRTQTQGQVVSWQWQYQLVAGGAWWNCSQATAGYNTDTITVTATAKRNGFLYRCKITDSEGNVLITDPARLTVE